MTNMLIPVEYRIEGHPGVKITWVPQFVSVVGNQPAYWFVNKKLSPWDNRVLWAQNFRTWYWTGKGWHWCTPKQYSSAEEALTGYLEDVARNANRE